MNSKIIIAILVIIIAAMGVVLYNQANEEPSVTPPPTPPPASGPPPPASQQHSMIHVSQPQPNSQVSSPLVVSGEARGNWYFEASFPIKLLDANGNVLVQVPAQAQGEWMTTDFVPFTVTLVFPTPSTSTGTLVLEKDNPSGLPENDDSISIPVNF